ncbi:MAG: DUF3500 domain-containing protein [Planctomicrobium sp.]|jgi:hypothetical protein|nr:DUF3500 domain-containing protein [Planctomicrobium sp.]
MRSALTSSAIALLLFSSVGLTYFAASSPGENMTSAANAFVESLDADQKKTALLDYETPARLGWHFIPKDERKGLQIKFMNKAQQEKAHQLLKAALSEMGYQKTTQIMALEKILNEFEEGKGRWARDHERYYFTIFGTPAKDAKWGLSYEGHHLSLNFVVENNKMISSTPQFFATNPATVQNENKVGVKVGTRVLAKEETLAFELVNSLNDDQASKAILSDEAPAEIRDAGSPQPSTGDAEGVAYSDLKIEQKSMLLNLVEEYAKAVADPVAKQRIDELHYDGLDQIHFAWAGATKPGIGHYYRIQGRGFLIEFVNTQPDAAGNPANHVHCVYRDMDGDFALPIE